ncbi:MAG: amino acid ABC transporter permease [Telmatospirillum sp.]|nr:amino acid ABC transporter permease [Telmatospirillum sp.]
MDFAVVLHYLPFLLQAALGTIEISLLSLVFGSALGLAICLMRIGNSRALSGFAFVYVWIIRGTPLLLQILAVYYWLPTVGLRLSPYVAGVVTLSVGISAYYAEIFRAAINGVPTGQAEAGYAVGMAPFQVMRRIVLPLAVRPALPPYVGQSITLVKNTSLVSVISVKELMFTAESLYSSTYKVAEILGTAGLIYLLLTTFLQAMQTLLEKRLGYYVVK